MKVWWCEKHGGSAVEDLRHCWKRQWLEDVDGAFEPCRMVEMQLVPADALVVVKENGKWPDWAVDAVYYEANGGAGQVPRILDGLAAGSREAYV